MSNLFELQRMGAELRRAILLFVDFISSGDYNLPDKVMMEMSGLYPEWESLIGKPCKAKSVFRYGTNSVGDPQLWSFISDYTPVSYFTPDQDITHYKKIGVSETGVAIWTQPFAKEDSYGLRDVVYNIEDYYMSLHPYNVWEPGGIGVPEGLWVKLPKTYQPGDELPAIPGEPEEPETPEEPGIPEEPVEPEEPNPEEPSDPPNANGTARWSEWINPVGYESQGVYGENDGVTFEGQRKISNYNNNGLPPSDSSWWRDA